MKYPYFYKQYCLTHQKHSDSIIYYNETIRNIINEILAKLYKIGVSQYNQDYEMIKLYITHIYEALITINETDNIQKFVSFFTNINKMRLYNYHTINNFCIENNIVDAIYDEI
jgi:hypothetical protein